MQAGELPFVVAAWVVAVTAIAAAQSDLDNPVGVVGAAIALLDLCGLVVVTGRALQARGIAQRAIADGLSLGEPQPVMPQARRPWLRLILAPLAVRRRDVIRRANLPYGPAGRVNLLDVYLPRSGVATGPCLVYFHGGGYYSGRKNREARALIYRLASQGWVCVSANYRLARTERYPAALVDAKRAIAWLREQAPGYGADPDSIVVAGSSAGAHLAAMAALTPDQDSLQPGFEASSTDVAAAICLYGFYGAPTWVDCDPGAPSAPIEELDSGAPPMLIANGTRDSFVSIDGVRDFVHRFHAVAPQTPLVYVELPGAQHTFDLYHSIRFDAVLGAVDAFTADIQVAARSTG
jgi:acetyl esterase/lipase